jgi:preprotein translocase subunit SecE
VVERLKLILAALAVLAGLAGYYLLGDKPLVLRLVALLAGLGVAVGLTLMTSTGQTARDFIKGAWLELRKVVWPSRKETTQVTLIVFVLVILISIFLWIVDWAMLALVKALTGQGA